MDDAGVEFDQGKLVRRWLRLAVGSLILAGVFALLLVLARMPPLSNYISDPLFFRRGLVIHVVLALVVWFYAFIAAAFSLLPARGGASAMARLGPSLGLIGVVLLMVAAGLQGARPILSNYIPMIDHPLFVTALVVFALGVASTMLDRRLLPGREAESGVFRVPLEARPFLRGAAVAFLLALLTFLASAITTNRLLAPEIYYEVVAWGGGHVLQFACASAMLAVWLMLLGQVLPQPVMSRGTAALLAAVLIAPVLAAPMLAGLGTADGSFRGTFTRLMELGIFPVVIVVLVLSVRALVRSRREGALGAARLRDPAITGFVTSAVLTVVGFVLGALIDGSNTLVPAHYHAAVGAVTVSFMALTWPLLGRLGVTVRGARTMRAIAWQPVLFGVGQTVFAIGFAFAGAHGMGRKLYGQEQNIRSAAEWAGLLVMGLGGLVAIAAGLLFIGIVMVAWLRAASGGKSWSQNGNIPSKS